jgi:hypothetical protein
MPDFPFLTTHVGSVPHTHIDGVAEEIAAALDLPAWPQFSRRSYLESMYVQYAPLLPGIVFDDAKEKAIFDTTGDITPALETFYQPVLDDNVDAFALRPEHASGFFAMLDVLRKSRGDWAKGQITGPISFGLTITDQALRASLYDDLLADPIVKNTAFTARWQVRQLKALRPNVLICVDEPYMASFGSAFISLSREQVVAMLDEVFEAIHSEGGLAAVHCCANTDWGLLLSTSVDVLNLDAWSYLDTLALYPQELRAFLDRGGAIMWGVVPNSEEIFSKTPQAIAEHLQNGIRSLCEKAAARGVTIRLEEFATRSLIAPACGLGPANEEIAGKVFEVLPQVAKILRETSS